MLIDTHDYTQDDLASIVGKSRPHISNMMRLLNLPDEIHQFILQGKMTAGQVRPLIGHEDALKIAQIVIEKQLSARDVEKLARHEQPSEAEAALLFGEDPAVEAPVAGPGPSHLVNGGGLTPLAA